MLLGPQFSEQVGDPAVESAEPVEPRVTGTAEGDQRVRKVRGAAVVDDERRRGVTDAAEPAVAAEDFSPAPREAGAAPAPVAGPTPPPVKESETPTGAAERELSVRIGGHGGRLFNLR